MLAPTVTVIVVGVVVLDEGATCSNVCSSDLVLKDVEVSCDGYVKTGGK